MSSDPAPQRRFRLRLPRAGAPLTPEWVDVEAPRSLYVPRRLQQHGLAGYQAETLACFLATLEAAPAGEVLDVGANVGVFGWLAAATGRKVVAFEPTPETAECNAAVSSRNGLDVEVERLALGDEAGSATLYLSSRSDVSNSLKAGFREAKGSLEVRVETIDGYCRRRGLRPSVVKIDTESTEPAVLSGGRELLREARPWLICEVLPGRAPVRLAELLQPLRYLFHRITDEVPLPLETNLFGAPGAVHRNWLFAPESPADAYWDRLARWKEAVAACNAQARRLPVPAPALAFGAGWRPERARGFRVAVRGDSAEIVSDLEAGRHVYYCRGRRGFEEAGEPEDGVPVEAERRYGLEIEVRGATASPPRLQLWALQYDDARRRIRSKRVVLRQGTCALAFETGSEARSIRVAIRVAGPGTIELGPIRCYRLEEG